jgi:ribosome-binding protein aMBF1 (putative translation factor)
MNDEEALVATPFNALKTDVMSSWNDDARKVYVAASELFAEELAARAALGAQLASARAHKGLSQRALAELCSVDQAEISRIERGVSNPTADTLNRIASTLNRALTLAVVT